MTRQQDSDTSDPGRQGPSSPRTPGHRVPGQVPGQSSPSDTRSNAASGLTQQGLENQRPGGERHDASSEMQPGSTLDARHEPPDGQGLGERAKARGQLGKPLASESMLDDEDPADPRERL